MLFIICQNPDGVKRGRSAGGRGTEKQQQRVISDAEAQTSQQAKLDRPPTLLAT